MSRFRYIFLGLVLGGMTAWAGSNVSILAEVSAALGVNDAIKQILHIGDTDGLEATEHTVRDIDGTTSALDVGTLSVTVDGDFAITGSMDELQFTTGLVAPDHSEGLIFYDDTEKCLAYYNNRSDVTHQAGRELWTRATNKTGSTITNGTLVYVSGAQGNRPTMAPAKADAPATARILAMATEEILDNMTGEFTTFGGVHDLNTSADTAGTAVYLSASVAGVWTSTAPLEPNFPIFVGTVTRQNANDGIIELSLGPTDVVSHMVIQSIAINDSLNVAGDVTYTGGGGIMFGHMYMDGDFTTTIGNADPTEVDTGLVAGNLHRISFPDDHYLTVPVDGHYAIAWNMSFSLTSAAGQPQIHAGVMIDGVGLDEDGEGHRSILTANDVGSMGANTILDLSANEQISIFVQNLTNTTDVVVGHLNVTLWMMGGT